VKKSKTPGFTGESPDFAGEPFYFYCGKYKYNTGMLLWH
jgi:hypothetical protein